MARATQVKVYDAIVLGSGAGGMTAAQTIAHAGRSVLVLEAGKQFGGMLNPFKRKQYKFDIGWHYVGDCGREQTMGRILESIGLGEIAFRELDPDRIDRYVFPSGEGILMKGIDRWCDHLASQFPAEAAAIRRFERLLYTAAAFNTTRPNLRHARNAVAAPLALLRSLRTSFRALLDRYFREPLLKNIVCGPVGDVGVPPSRLPAIVGLGLLVHFMGGAYYPRGGTHAYRDAFVGALRANGADMLRNRRVTAVRVLRDGSFRVRADTDEEFAGRTVVSNIEAADMLPMLQVDREPLLLRFLKRRARNIRPSLGTVCVFLGVDCDLGSAEIGSTNVWTYPTGDIDSLYERVRAGELPDDPFFFLTIPTLKDPGSGKAPNGHHTIELITGAAAGPFLPWFDQPTMKRDRDYVDLKNAFADRIVAAVERRYIPGLRKHVVVREVSTPATHHSFVGSPAGGIYGPEMTTDQLFHKRFFPGVGVPGFYMCGGSVFGAGVMTCTLSGFVAGRLALRNIAQKRAVGAKPTDEGITAPLRV